MKQTNCIYNIPIPDVTELRKELESAKLTRWLKEFF